jgi:hypothetical protein
MTTHAESMVLVEGYDDRDFWKGLLLRQGCTEARREPPARHRQSSAFTYLAPAGTLIHVLPYKAPQPGFPEGAELEDLARLKLRDRVDKPLRRLVLSPDADSHTTLDAARQSVRSIVTSACPDATETEEGDFVVKGKNEIIVSTMFVHAGAARDDEGRLPRGVPEQAAIEQLACAALCRAYPKRGEAVAQWLANRPDVRGKDHKAHAWSFYAGWSTHHGTGYFYNSLWDDPKVADELAALLRAQGAWRVIEALLQP